MKRSWLVLVIALCGVGSVFAGAAAEPGAAAEGTAATTTAAEPGKWNEAPMLRQRVAAGELPPVAQRLPEEPLVVEVLEGIGQYGGVISYARNPNSPKYQTHRMLYEFYNTYTTPYRDKILPNVMKGWQINEDASTFRFFMRNGMKWSDGQPFTADDVLFWYQDIILNDDLTPSKPGALTVGGELGKVTKIDDYTVEFSFAAANGVFLESLGRWRPEPYAPGHHLKQYHPAYTSQETIAELMKDEGYDRWSDFFVEKVGGTGASRVPPPEAPSISAWVALNKAEDTTQVLERNPYYWKVDTAGNQLPYVDRIETPMFDQEAWILKILAGELTYAAGGHIGGITNLPTIMQRRDSGNYRVVQSTLPAGSYGTIFLNYSHEDPFLKELFNDHRFRVALSIGIDREVISDLVFRGQAVASQPSPGGGPPYYGDTPIFKVHTEHDSDRANVLLDEIGLTTRDGEGFRLRPDGSELSLVNLVSNSAQFTVDMAELYKTHWKEIGIKVINKPIGGRLWGTQKRAGEFDIATNWNWVGGRPMNFFQRGDIFPAYVSWSTAPAWATWLVTMGAEGEEPPAGVKRLRELYEEGLKTVDEEKSLQLVNEAFKISSENVWRIGVLTEPAVGRFYVLSNKLRNAHRPDEPLPDDLYATPVAAWYIEQ